MGDGRAGVDAGKQGCQPGDDVPTKDHQRTPNTCSVLSLYQYSERAAAGTLTAKL